MSLTKLLPFSIAFIFLFSSCEKEKGAFIDSTFSSLELHSASLSSSHINLDDTTDIAITKLANGNFKITDTLFAAIPDCIDCPVLQVYYKIYAPGESSPFSVGKLDHSPENFNRFRGIFSFVIVRTDIGLFRVEVYAQSFSGEVSNVFQLPLVISRRNSAPVLGVPTVREYTPIGSESTRVTLTIPVADSNGFADVATVTVRTRNTKDSSIIPMSDDGAIVNGDQALGDGIFSLIVWITPTLSLSNVEFEFIATDHEGSQSIPAYRALANHPPQIVYLNVPDSIKRPASGTQLIGFYEKVFDPDGLQDIDSVYFRNFSSANPSNILMYDDGDLVVHGDSTAADGTYSRIVSIDPSNTLGNKEFHFYVIDKSGAKATVIKTITIY